MIDKHNNTNNLLFKEMDPQSVEEWFSFTKTSFLHNVDTFYYSVKFKNDFRARTKDKNVLRLRRYFDVKYRYIFDSDDPETGDFYMKDIDKHLVLRPITFSRFYNICISYPEYFDIFIAPSVPKAGDGGESVTAECIVQLRSYMLWQYGVRDSFENSYRYVQSFAKFFGLEISEVKENRIDYCWHTNF